MGTESRSTDLCKNLVLDMGRSATRTLFLNSLSRPFLAMETHWRNTVVSGNLRGIHGCYAVEFPSDFNPSKASAPVLHDPPHLPLSPSSSLSSHLAARSYFVTEHYLQVNYLVLLYSAFLHCRLSEKPLNVKLLTTLRPLRRRQMYRSSCPSSLQSIYSTLRWDDPKTLTGRHSITLSSLLLYIMPVICRTRSRSLQTHTL